MRTLLFGCVLLALVACGGVAPATDIPATPTQAATALPTATLLPTPTPAPSLTPAPSATATPPVLDSSSGRPSLARGQLTSRPFAVMIDNHPDAYPQTGLDEAALVFEALAEFGITRYMAVFAPSIAPLQGEVGPVRSARLYFVQWAMGLSAIYVHAGGSPTGLERLAADSDTLVINLDALADDNEQTLFRRDLDRFAPHNLYTNQASVATYAGAHPGATPLDLSKVGYLFTPDAPLATPEASSLGYYFLYSDDPVSWEYAPETNRYLRFRRGRPHVDAVSQEQLWFKSVVVMEVEEAPIPGDPKARIDQKVIGSGPAVVFANGAQIEATWRKDDESGPLQFFDASGAEISFPVGPLWIAAIPALDNLSVEQ